MGHGIAQVFASGGNEVILTDVSDEILNQAKQKIRENLDAFVKHEILTSDESEKIFTRIKYSADNAAAAKECSIMVEAVPENLELKKQIFSLYEANSSSDVLLASNTSGIPIKEIAKAVTKKDRVLGIHFYNPAQLNRLVEIIRTDATSDTYVNKARSVLTQCGKTPVIVADIPGFLHNRLIYALLREAVHLVENGLTTVEDVDIVVREAFGPRFSTLGLFKLVDLVGIDIYHSVSSYLNRHLSNTTETSPWIKSKVENKELGVKSGKGFYTWTDEIRKETLARLNATMLQRLKTSV